MNKAELIKAIMTETGLKKAEAAKVIENMDVVVEIIAKNLEVGAKAKIGDYVVVEKKEVPARTYRNPKTGEEIEKDSYVTVKVKASAAAKRL